MWRDWTGCRHDESAANRMTGCVKCSGGEAGEEIEVDTLWGDFGAAKEFDEGRNKKAVVRARSGCRWVAQRGQFRLLPLSRFRMLPVHKKTKHRCLAAGCGPIKQSHALQPLNQYVLLTDGRDYHQHSLESNPDPGQISE